MDYSSNDLSTSVSIIIDVGAILDVTTLEQAQVVDELSLIVLKLLIACQRTQSSYYWNYRFFDSRQSYSKTPVELNNYITLLRKNNYFSLNPFDFSYEVINSSSFSKWKEQLGHMFDVISIGKKMQKSSKLTQSVEEQQQRITHLKQEIDASSEAKNKYAQQLQKENEYLNERLFLSLGTVNPERTPFQAWLQTIEEAQHSLGVESFSPTNIFFIGDLTNVIKRESSDASGPADQDNSPQSITIHVIDRSIPLREKEFQAMNEQTKGKEAQIARSIRWIIHSFSDVLLSSFSLLPFFPTAFPRRSLALDSYVFFTNKMDVVVNGLSVGEAVCVDINQYTVNQEEEKEEEKEEENVTAMGDSYLIVVNGTRILMSKEEYEEEKRRKKEEVKEESVESLVLTVDSVRDMDELNVAQLVRNVYYLVSCQTMAFAQLIHSLVLQKQVLVFLLNEQYWYGIPFTSTTLYLFAVDVNMSIPMVQKMDCSSLFRQNTNDLFFYWNSQAPSHVFPQDLANSAYIRKLSKSKETVVEEDAFIAELRGKLQTASIDAIDSSSQKYLHVGDLGSIIKSVIDENYTAILGMMNEEVDWYIKQIDELRIEFKKDMECRVFNEKVVGYLQSRLLSETEISKKYNTRMISSATHVRFREFILQVLIRLYIYKCSPDEARQKPSTDPIPSSVLKTVVHLLKQITYVFDLNDGTKTYLDRVFCPLFESSLPRSLATIYDKLEIECPFKVIEATVKPIQPEGVQKGQVMPAMQAVQGLPTPHTSRVSKERREVSSGKRPPPPISLLHLQKEAKPINRKTARLTREKNTVDLLATQLKKAAISSSIVAPSFDFKTIQHRVSKKKYPVLNKHTYNLYSSKYFARLKPTRFR